MNERDLKPAGTLAARLGVKCVLYGEPGSGKTPLACYSPNPVLLATEPGLLSLRGFTVPTFEAYEAKKVDEFFEWFFKSKESEKYDTLIVDSLTQMAELVLIEEAERNKDGRAVYGAMLKRVSKICSDLYYMPRKHIVMIAKQGLVENGKQVVNAKGMIGLEPVMQKRPTFPGKELNVFIPHLFDCIFHLSEVSIPGQPRPVKALRTKGIPEILARERSGKLAEFEPPNFPEVFKKITA